jgi:CheY-like chemotaxis protein
MTRARRILIVDDNEALRDNLAELLESEGYEVRLAPDGVRALDSLAADPLPDVVLVDLLMPGMDGNELLSRIREDTRLAPLRVVLSTGMPSASARAAAQADAFLAKPFGMRDLLLKIEQLCMQAA